MTDAACEQIGDRASGALGGLRAGFPVMLGYFPVAFAFGASAAAIGITIGQASSISALMYSGANQAFLLAAIPAGMAIPLMILLTSAASLRHLLYGLVLRSRIAADRTRRAVFALGLTDEVFATALAATANGWQPGGRWLIAVALTAWAAWTGGSIIGAAAGDALGLAVLEGDKLGGGKGVHPLGQG